MPFGKWGNSDECVADFEGKVDDPKALCGWLEKNLANMTRDLPDEAKQVFEASLVAGMAEGKDENSAHRAALAAVQYAGWKQRNGAWVKTAENAAIKTRRIVGMQIFHVGEYNGEKYSRADLQQMVENFKTLSGRLDPPLKIGHTSDEFNKALAAKMGVPEEVLKGEKGKGAMALGWFSALRLEGDTLVGDLTDVPEPVAQLIEAKSYNKVSAEIFIGFEDEGKNYGKVLGAVSLLGAEIPAVLDIDGLEKVAIHTQIPAGGVQVEFDVEGGQITKEELEESLRSVGEALETAIRNRPGAKVLRALWNEVAKKARDMVSKKHKLEEEAPPLNTELKPETNEEAEMDLLRFAKLLGLAEDAGESEIETAIKGLMEQKPNEYADLKAKVETLEHSLESTGKALEVERRTRKLEKYTRFAEGLTAIQGKPEDLAEQIVTAEEANPEAAWVMACSYAESDRLLKQAGVLAQKGTAGEGDHTEKHGFEVAVEKYQLDNNVSRVEATAEVAKGQPELYNEFQKAQRAERPKLVDQPV